MIGLRDRKQDADWALIDRYLAREMSEREAQRFERRLVDDEELFEKASPLIGLFWFGAGSSIVRVQDPAERRESQERVWHESRRATGLPEAPFVPEVEPLPAENSAAANAIREMLLDESLRILPTRRTMQWIFGATAAVLVAGSAVQVTRSVNDWSARRRDARDGLARSDWMRGKERLEAADSVITARFKDGSEAVLSPGSHFTFHGLNTVQRFDTAAVAIDGDARFTLSAQKDSARIRTPEIDAEVRPGTYRIHAIPKSGATTIWVDEGEATVFGLVAPMKVVTLHAGEHGTFGATGRLP